MADQNGQENKRQSIAERFNRAGAMLNAGVNDGLAKTAGFLLAPLDGLNNLAGRVTGHKFDGSATEWGKSVTLNLLQTFDRATIRQGPSTPQTKEEQHVFDAASKTAEVIGKTGVVLVTAVSAAGTATKAVTAIADAAEGGSVVGATTSGARAVTGTVGAVKRVVALTAKEAPAHG